MKFYYKAADNSGNKTAGVIDTESQDKVAEILSQKGLIPISIQTNPFRERKLASSKGLFGKVSVTPKEKILFIRQLATLLEASCPIDRALDLVLQRASTEAFGDLVTDMRKAIEGGKSLSAAMAEKPEVFSGLQIGMVSAGDEGGFLAQALNQLADYEEKQAKLRSQLVQALTYPAFMVAVMILSCIVLFKFVIPSILEVVTQVSSELPLPTVILMETSDFMERHLLTLVIVIALASFAYYRYVQTPAGRSFHDRLKLRLPLLGAINQKVIVSRICRVLSMLLAGDVRLVRSLEIAAVTAQNVIVERELIGVANKVKTGEQLSVCFEVCNSFPSYVSSMMQLGEETGSLESMLAKVAEEYEEEYQSGMKTAVSLVEPMMIAIMGILIGFVIIAVFLPMANMSANV